jgi:CheY-like chemotaxis protein
MNIAFGPILVVEDVPNVLELLEVTLRFKGYPVISARNGQEALEQVNKEHPALVITDILMPKMDGYALAYRLRADPLTRQIPLIFLSATYVTLEDKQFAISLGAVRFIEKPIDTEEFLLTVAELLTGARKRPPNHSASVNFMSVTVSGWSTSCATRTPRFHALNTCSPPCPKTSVRRLSLYLSKLRTTATKSRRNSTRSTRSWKNSNKNSHAAHVIGPRTTGPPGR